MGGVLGWITLNAIYGLSRCLYGDLPILGEIRDNKMDGINGFEREKNAIGV